MPSSIPEWAGICAVLLAVWLPVALLVVRPRVERRLWNLDTPPTIPDLLPVVEWEYAGQNEQAGASAESDGSPTRKPPEADSAPLRPPQFHLGMEVQWPDTADPRS